MLNPSLVNGLWVCARLNPRGGSNDKPTRGDKITLLAKRNESNPRIRVSSKRTPPKTSNARRKQLSKDYHDTVNLSIWDLDDGVTSPEIIARAALSRGAERYRAWKRVTVVEDLDLTQYERGQLEELLSDFPDRQTVDLWTGFVLERRRRGGDLLPEGRKRLKELGIN